MKSVISFIFNVSVIFLCVLLFIVCSVLFVIDYATNKGPLTCVKGHDEHYIDNSYTFKPISIRFVCDEYEKIEKSK